MIRVLFVCLGNICRSPMAEAVFHHKINEAGLSVQIEVDSAGTGSWHVGEPPHRGTRQLLDDLQISHAGQRARQITRDDLNEFDYILTMDEANLSGVRALGTGKAVVRPLMDFAPHLGTSEVPDPYYTGGFARTHALIDAACDGLLAAIRKEHGL